MMYTFASYHFNPSGGVDVFVGDNFRVRVEHIWWAHPKIILTGATISDECKSKRKTWMNDNLNCQHKHLKRVQVWSVRAWINVKINRIVDFMSTSNSLYEQ